MGRYLKTIVALLIVAGVVAGTYAADATAQVQVWNGDLDGSTNANKVVTGIANHALPALAVGALSWDGGSWYFGSSTGAGDAGQFLVTSDAGATTWVYPHGDVDASATDPGALTVNAIQGFGVSTSVPSTGNALVYSSGLWRPSAINLAGGSASVTGTLPTANQAAQTMAGDVTGTTAANIVTGITGDSVTHIVTASASTIKETGSTLSIADGTSVVRDVLDMTHGRITAGGGGTDYSATIGPMPTLESSFAAFYLLPNGTSPNTSNWLIDYNGSSPHFNSPNSGAPILFYDTGTTLLLSIASSGITVGRSVMQWDSSLSTATLGTNRAGATLILAADAATTVQTLSAQGTDFSGSTLSSFPSSGKTRVYTDSADGKLKAIDPSGNIFVLAP